MKTIAVHEQTYEVLEDLREKWKSDSFNALLLRLVAEAKKTPSSLFGSLCGKAKPFTTKERHAVWGERQ